MRKAMMAVFLVFAVTLAAVVGNRMSAEAMAVVIGIVCGVAAAIPMSLLILLVSRRREQAAEDYTPYGPPTRREGAYPPVVVIQGGSPAPTHLQPPYYSSSVDVAPRQFHIVGEDE